jgi:NAD+ diphosphatase
MFDRFNPSINQPHEKTQPAWWFVFQRDKVLVALNGSTTNVPSLINPDDLGLDVLRRQYLGALDGKDCYSAEVAEPSPAPPGMEFQGLRQLFGRMEEGLYRVAFRATQIVDWDRNHQFCGRCGAHTADRTDIRAKECPNCRFVMFPRISPAVIVLVERGDRVLLARANRFPGKFYSVLAGFVEPGETLEEAVAREIKEEVGIEVKDIRYFGSQPWPFPDSLMIAFTATYAGGEIRIDEEEIMDAGWFEPDSFPDIPGKISISRQLIDWYVTKHRKE